MEFTREIYWNVGDGLWTLVPMYLLTLAALFFLFWGGLKRIKVYRQGRSINRTDNLGHRILGAFKTIMTQGKVLRGTGAGIFHGFFFWGFFILFVGTCLIVIQADFTDPLFGVKFLKGSFYKLFSITLDIAGILALVMLGGLFVRRYLFRPEGLESQKDDVIMHSLLFSILVTGFLIEGARMAVTEIGTPLAVWSPIGLVVAQAFSGIDEPALRSFHISMWWLHMVLVIGMIVIIPFTKFRHIFTTGLNYVFADNGPKGNLLTLDLEDEEAESFGASKIKDMSWKDIFDTDACTECKRCQDRCPAHTTDKPLSPMKVIDQLGDIAVNNPESNLIETVTGDAIWSCTTCRACQDICPASIEHVNKIVDMRRNLVLMEGEFPGEEVMTAVDQVEVNGNPLGIGYASRGDWIDGLPVVTLENGMDTDQLASVDILYFVGCYGSFDKRNIEIAKSFVRLCDDAGIKVGIMGKEEKCCGEPVRKLGNEYLYQSVAAENIEKISSFGIDKIVTTCPHCFNTLSKDYRDLGFDLQVEHYTVFLMKLLESGQLKVQSMPFECSYHDSCYLGRYNNIFEAPRSLIEVAGGKIREMEKNRAESFCCSAGGGRILAEEKLGERINVKRVNMASATGAEWMVSNCPFCLTMFEDGIKGADLDDRIAAKDIAEILVERL